MDFEIRRKTIHVLEGSAALFSVYFDFFPVELILSSLLIGLGISFLIKRRETMLDKLSEKFGREENKNTIPGQGSIFLAIGILLSVIFFDKNVAMAAIVTVTFGDSIGALVGMYFGRLKNPFNRSKHVEGTLAGFAVAALINTLFLAPLTSILVSAIGLIIESIDFELNGFDVDDNLTVPISVGVAYLVLMALPI